MHMCINRKVKKVKKTHFFQKKNAIEDLFESAIPKIVGYTKNMISEVQYVFALYEQYIQKINKQITSRP